MPIFIFVFLGIYSLANYYVLNRSLQALHFLPTYAKVAVWGVFILGTFSYILSKSLLSKMNNVLYDIVLWFGSVWFAVILYSFLLCIVIDLLRLARLGLMALNKNTYIPAPAGWMVFLFAAILIIGYVGYGCYNFRNIKVKELAFDLKNPAKEGKDIRILFFSDAHLTPINNGTLMNKVLAIIGDYKPDLILLGGDIVDDRAEQLDRAKIGERMKQMKAPLGVYTCPGNHEYISGYKDAAAYIEAHGVTILRDSAVNIGGFFTVIGRDDNSGLHVWGQRRLSIQELVNRTDKTLPVIVLDHQPFHLEQAEQAGVDIQLSGHTHNGQMFPANLLTEKIYEKSWGLLKKGKTNFYVSSGIGGWGPPVRTASDAEAIIINIHFTK